VKLCLKFSPTLLSIRNYEFFLRENIGVLVMIFTISSDYFPEGRSQWLRDLRQELSSLARTLGSWVRIPLEAWMSVFMLGSGLTTD
jgi:hypothetical protein